jgi:hypothetical protein
MLSPVKKTLLALIVVMVLAGAGVYSLNKYLDYLNKRAADRAEEERVRAASFQPVVIDEAEKWRQEKEASYNACVNQSYKDYQEDLKFNCRVVVDGQCKISPEENKVIQDKFIEKKKECEKLK